MRNLKKVLALVLTLALALSVAAGAAFTDQKQIKNTEAVDACVALNIIGGYPDGSYKPEGNITRAEFCKMICIALNGGKEPTLGTTTKATFTDVRTSANSAWAEKYIESCVSQGIVSGIGGGKFAPNNNVTGSEAAKMLLVALGYKSENEGFTGASWEVNVNVVASSKGLYEGLGSIDASKALTRDNAAQMVWNALNAYEVEYKTNLVSTNGQLSTQVVCQDKVVGDNNDKITLLEDKYEALAITGTLTSAKKESGKDTYTIEIEDAKYKGAEYNDGEVAYTDVSKDYSDLLYQNVRVLVKPDKNGKDAVVYGVYATNKNTTQSGLLADLKKVDDENKVKLNGTKYNLADNTKVYVDGKLATTTVKNANNEDVTVNVTIKDWVNANAGGNKTNEKGSNVELLATNGTTKYSILKVTTYAVAKVTYVGSDYVTAGTKYEDDSYVLDSKLKKDDYAVISKAGNYANDKGRVDKATVVEGKITSTKTNSDNKINKVVIDGTWYETNAAMTGNSALRMSASVKLVLVNGYIYDVDTITAGTADIALIVELGENNSVGSKYYQARLILADGTDKVVDVEKKDGNGSALVSSKVPFSKYDNMLATYDVSKDVYTLTVINGQTAKEDLAGYENFYYTTAATIDGSISATKEFSNNDNNDETTADRAYFYDTATVFVKYNKDGDYKVVSGKAVKGWDKTTVSGSATTVRMLTEADKNAQYVGAAFVDLCGKNIPGGSDKTYAVALDSSYSEKIDGTTYTMVKAWNGTEEATYKYEGTMSISAGQIFEYSADGEGTVDIDLYEGVDTQVKTYDVGSGEITFSADSLKDAVYKIDSKDTVVLYVDSANGSGEKDGEIQLAPKFAGDGTNTDNNVTVYIDGIDGNDTDVTVIVVDVKNNMDW